MVDGETRHDAATDLVVPNAIKFGASRADRKMRSICLESTTSRLTIIALSSFKLDGGFRVSLLRRRFPPGHQIG